MDPLWCDVGTVDELSCALYLHLCMQHLHAHLGCWWKWAGSPPYSLIDGANTKVVASGWTCTSALSTHSLTLLSHVQLVNKWVVSITWRGQTRRHVPLGSPSICSSKTGVAVHRFLSEATATSRSLMKVSSFSDWHSWDTLMSGDGWRTSLQADVEEVDVNVDKCHLVQLINNTVMLLSIPLFY